MSGIQINSGSLELIETQTASGVATLDFIKGISVDPMYVFVVEALKPVTSDANLHLRISVDGGSIWKSGATDYEYQLHDIAEGVEAIRNGGAGKPEILLGQAVDEGASRGWSGEIKIFNADVVGVRNMMFIHGGHLSNSGNQHTTRGHGFYNANNPGIDGVRFLFSSGNIDTGIVSLYRMRK